MAAEASSAGSPKSRPLGGKLLRLVLQSIVAEASEGSSLYYAFIKAPCTDCHPFSASLPHSAPSISGNHLPGKLLTQIISLEGTQTKTDFYCLLHSLFIVLHLLI